MTAITEVGPRPGSTLKTIDKALTVLGFFTVETPEFRLTDLARAADLDKVTTMRVLASLAHRGFVEQDTETKKYRLGPAVLRLARVREASFPLLAVVDAILADLALQCGETAHAAEFNQGALCTIAVQYPERSSRIIVHSGPARSFHGTATGLAFLGASPASFAEAVLQGPMEAYTTNTIVTPEALRAEIAVIRTRGYSISDQAREIGVSSVAAAFCDPQGRPLGTVALAMPAERASPAQFAALGRQVNAAARKVEQHLFGTA